MVSDERKQELSAICKEFVDSNTCAKAHHFTVGKCIACERDALRQQRDLLLEALRDMVSDRDCLSAATVEFARNAIERATVG